MANKKRTSKKSILKKTTLIKIAEKVGELAGRIANQKDHLVEAAGDAIESVKTAVKHITANKKPVAKKPAAKAAKKVTKKASGATPKKSARPVKVKKIIKKSVKKVSTKK